MVEIIGVRFKSGGKQYYFDPAGLEVQPGQGVIVETSRGLEYGEQRPSRSVRRRSPPTAWR